MSTAQVPSFIDYLTAFGAILTPMIILVISGFGWRYRTRVVRRTELEDKLREDRIVTYNKILEPFFIAFTPDEVWQESSSTTGTDKMERVREILFSPDHRNAALKLTLVGTDNVVKAYNNLMHHFFNQEDVTESGESNETENVLIMLRLLGIFLLQIRKSMGNEHTVLGNTEMLEWFISDARDV